MRAALCAAFGLAVLSTIPSCLETLPAPLQCPAKAKFDACSGPGVIPPRDGPAPPAPPSTSDGVCSLPRECLSQQGRTCECTAASQCTRADSCSPPPDCPSSVRGAVAGAKCVDGTTSFVINSPRDAMCVCGCASCAEACDGQGPILGSGQGLRVELPRDLPSRGKLGVMVRVRGSGILTALLNAGGKTRPLSAPPSTGSRDEFVDLMMGPAADWSADAKPLGLVVSSSDVVEIDCVVPYFTP